MRLFLRLTSDVNERLRFMMRHCGDLSRYVDPALTSTDLGTVELELVTPGRSAPALMALSSGRPNARVRSAARQRGCAVTTLANSALRKWLEDKMPKKSDVQARVCQVGLCTSLGAVVAVSVTVLADNHSAGFGRVIPREEQMLLLLIVVLLFAVQAFAYLVHRTRRASTRATARTPSATPRSKTRF